MSFTIHERAAVKVHGEIRMRNRHHVPFTILYGKLPFRITRRVGQHLSLAEIFCEAISAIRPVLFG